MALNTSECNCLMPLHCKGLPLQNYTESFKRFLWNVIKLWNTAGRSIC